MMIVSTVLRPGKGKKPIICPIRVRSGWEFRRIGSAVMMKDDEYAFSRVLADSFLRFLGCTE